MENNYNIKQIKILKSKRFYICVAIMIITGVITFLLNYHEFGLDKFYHIGTLNAFIYSNIYANLFTAFFAPFLLSILILPDIINITSNKEITKRNLIKSIGSVSVKGGSLFFISYCISFLLCLIVFHTPSARITTNIGLFTFVYNESILLYCVVFIMYSSIYGAMISALIANVVLLKHNYFFALTVVSSLYYFSYLLRGIFSGLALKIVIYIFPAFPFSFIHTTNELEALSNFTFVLLATLILGIIGIKKNYKKLG